MSIRIKNTDLRENSRRGLKGLSVLTLFFLILSCQPINKEQNIWIENTDEISLSVKGRTILLYHPDSWQKGTSTNEFWTMSDDLSQYFHLRMDKVPIPGNSIETHLIFKFNDKKAISKRLKFETLKKDEAGKIWLYNHSQGYGLVIGPMK